MRNINIIPLGDRIIIKPIAKDEKTAGGIILPDTAQEKSTEGMVIAVGEGKVTNDGKLIKPKIKVNDTVLYGIYGGTELKVEGEDYLIMSENDVYGIINIKDSKK